MATSNISSRRLSVGTFIRRNLLVILIFMSMLFGIGLGCILRTSWSKGDKTKIFYLKFPGDVMLNTLRMVSVPLVVSSIVSSLASLSIKNTGSIGLKAITYYSVTTVCAVITGTVGIVIISIGKEATEQPGENSNSVNQLDSVLDMIRNAFPDNLVKATFSKKHTVLSKEVVESINNTIFNNTKYIVGRNISSGFKTVEVPTVTSVPGANMLGLIVVSIFFGCVLSSMEDKAKPLVDLFQCLYQAMMRLILIFIWFTPVGLMFMIAATVVQMEEPTEALKELSIFIPTVLLCLLLHGFGTVPFMYFVVTRKNPYKFVRNMSKALLTAFGTGSSAATLPFTMDELIKKNKVNSRVVNFIAPIGATINMDGTALYIAMLTIFISHRLGLVLDPVRYFVLGISAVGVSVGVAAVPGTGLMYMTVAAMAVGLPVDQVLITASFDWIFERFRTIVNVMGDSFGAGIVDHLNSRMLSRDETESRYAAGSEPEEVEEETNLV